ncbi:LuxR C-terminal-related transcriptional regulator [Algoriphagus namhaensis]|uniref:LuxR C-terminal-related transcriptional regulator n=1 Tax=Algoriphagus namhaensis TaxID=915353 RepID=A0ABV8AVV0_9BACT
MIRRKIQKPSLTPELITRKFLIEELNQNVFKPLTLVSAPAGYGKSMLLSQWIEQSKIKTAWISLDKEHNDLHTFLSIIIEAIQYVLPGVLEKIEFLLNSSVLPPTEVLFEELINGMDDLENNLAIVLDDYHLIKDHKIHELVNLYLQFPPENIHIVISTRKDPPLLINQLRLYNRIFEIRIDQLSFKEEEISEYILLNQKIEISKTVANQFLRKTEGWILGLKMLLFSAGEVDVYNASVSNLHHMKDFSNFIIQGLSKTVSGKFVELLLFCSILDRFNAPLIDHLITCTKYKGEYSGNSFIAKVLELNLFVVFEDNDKEWFRFHHLFQELIHLQLKEKLEQNEIDAYYLMISKWLLSHSIFDEAVNYGMKAKDYQYVASIVEKNRFLKYPEMRWWVVVKWMNQIPKDILFERPALISAEIFNCMETFQYSDYPPLIELLESKLNKYPDQIVEGELYFHKAFHNTFVNSNPDLALENLEKARNYPNIEEVLLRRMFFYTAVAMQFKGQYMEAVKYLRQEVKKNQSSKLSTLGYAEIAICLLEGKMIEAASAGKNYCTMMRGKHDRYIEAWGNFLYANALFQMDRTKESASYFSQALENHPLFSYRLSLDAKIGIILSQFFSNELPEEEYRYEELEYSAQNLDLLHIADSAKARLNLLNGNMAKALTWAHTYDEDFHLKDTQFLVEVPLITKARIYMAFNDMEKIQFTLSELGEYYEKLLSINNQFHLLDILVLQSIGFYKINDQDKALFFLEKALEFAGNNGFIRPFIEPGMQMKKMLLHLNIINKNKVFINKIINRIDSIYYNQKLNKNNNRSLLTREFHLSKREIEIIKEVSNGLRNQEIADKLFISLETVKSHIKNSMKKLNAKNRMHLVRKVQENGLIKN